MEYVRKTTLFIESKYIDDVTFINIFIDCGYKNGVSIRK
jgi:hypothetical protein